MVERTADYIDPDNWTCPECGSANVEEQVWREANGGAVTAAASSDYYCGNGCGIIDYLVMPGDTVDG